MKHLNILAFLIFSLLVAWVFMFSSETKRKIQRPILSMFGLVNKAAHAATADEDIVNGVNLSPAALTEKYTEEELAQRYSAVLRDMIDLRLIKAQHAQIQRDNRLLRQSLGFKNTHDDIQTGKHIAARVIRRESATWWDELWIDKGKSSGFGLQSPVLTTIRDPSDPYGDVEPALVGKVTALADGTAKVLLLTDERCKVAARVMQTPESGLLMGSRDQDGSAVLKLRYLSKNTDEVKPGLLVRTMRASGVIPANYVLGTVVKFEKRDFYGEATVKPAVDFNQLTDVFVLDRKTDEEIHADAELADAAAAAARNSVQPEPSPSPSPAPAPDGEGDGEGDGDPGIPNPRRAEPVPED